MGCGSIPEKGALNLTNPAQRQNYCATQFLMVDFDEQNDSMFRPDVCGEITFRAYQCKGKGFRPVGVKVPEHGNGYKLRSPK